jgi:NACHT domain
MGLAKIRPEVFERLCRAYEDKYGASSNTLVLALNERNQHLHGKTTSADVISEKTIRNFFDPNNTSRSRLTNLNYLCDLLLGKSYAAVCEDLERRDRFPIVEGLPKNLAASTPDDVSFLVEVLDEDELCTYRDKLNDRLKRLKLLDINRELNIEELYTEVTATDKVERAKYRTIQALMDELEASAGEEDSEEVDFSRSLGPLPEKRVAALDAVKQHRKLRVQGSGGSGKTTLLKILAMQLPDDPDVKSERLIPFFLWLKELIDSEIFQTQAFALEDALASQIKEFLSGVSIASVALTVRQLLRQDRCLILLDGLDELSPDNVIRVSALIDDLIKRYSGNRYVVSNRIGAPERIQQIAVTVEITSFNDSQIDRYVRNWFEQKYQYEPQEFDHKPEQANKIANNFLGKLNKNSAVKDLATSPLMVTLLCWTYEDRYELPSNQHQLLGDVVDVMMRRIDSKRRIERTQRDDGKLSRISRSRLLDMLGEIAYKGFAHLPQRKVFWRDWEITDVISEYIKGVSEFKQETLEEDAKTILNAIRVEIGLFVERAKDIFSFSHLAFQEYFTARYIVYSNDPKLLESVIDQHWLDRRWFVVFVIIAGRLTNGETLLKTLFLKANQVVESNQEIQALFEWLYVTTARAEVSSSAWRAYYLMVDADIVLYIDNAVQLDRFTTKELAIALRDLNASQGTIVPRTSLANIQLSLGAILTLAEDRASGKEFEADEEIVLKNLKMEKGFSLDEKLSQVIQEAKAVDNSDLVMQLVHLRESHPTMDTFTQEWKPWAAKLKQIMQDHLEIGTEVKLSDEAVKALKDYLKTALLLVQCLQSDSYASPELRSRIVNSLLLPIHRISSELLAD